MDRNYSRSASISDWNIIRTFMSGTLGVFIGLLIAICLGWF